MNMSAKSVLDEEATIRVLKSLYNDYRTALLNKKYYGCKLVYVQRWNLWLNVLIAVTAGGGGAGGFTEWMKSSAEAHEEINIAWSLLSAGAGLVAVLKQYVHLDVKIENYSKLFTEYTKIASNFRVLVQRVQQYRAVPAEIVSRYDELAELFADLEARDDPKPSARLLDKMQMAVNSEVPPNQLWLP